MARASLTDSEVASISQLYADTSWIVRRVESVSVLDDTFLERVTSFTIDASAVHGLVHRKRKRGEQSTAYYVPLSLLPKGLLLDFDVRAEDGCALPLAGRAVDSMASARILAKHARPAGPVPRSAKLALFRLAYDFPPTMTSPVPKEVFLRLDSDARSLLNGQGLAWWNRAVRIDAFCSGVIEFGTNFLALVPLRLEHGPQVVVKMRRLEEQSKSVLPHLQRQTPWWRNRPGRSLLVPVHEIGRAKSEHIKLTAPSGTFFSDPMCLPLLGGHITYLQRSAGNRVTIYTTSHQRGNYWVLLTLWPIRTGFTRPAAYLTGYGAAVLWLGAVTDYLSSKWWPGSVSFLWTLRSHSEAVVTLLVVLPSILIAYIVREGEHETRNRLLKFWRELALASLVPLWGSSITSLLSPRLIRLRHLWPVWGSMAILDTIVFLLIMLQWYRLWLAGRRAARLARRNIGVDATVILPPTQQPRKWLRMLLDAPRGLLVALRVNVRQDVRSRTRREGTPDSRPKTA